MVFQPTWAIARRQWPNRTAIAAGTAIAAVVLTQLTWPFLRPTPFILGLAAAILSSRARGRYAGLLATLLAALGFFMFPLPLPNDRPGLLVGFVIVAGTFSWVVARRYEIEASLRESESRLAQDITARKVAEATVARSERRLKTILDAQPACVRLTSPDGLLVDMNAAGLRMLGAKDLSQVVQSPVSDVVHPEDRERFVAVHRAASSGVPGRLEFRIVNLDGREFWVDSHMVPFDAAISGGDGSDRLVLSVTSDITDRKHLEEQLRQAQKMDAVGRLAGGIAHDFNNLLTVISGFTETALLEIGDDAKAAGDLHQVYKAADTAAALTRQLLLFSRKQVETATAINLNTVISNLEHLLRRTLGAHIQIELRLGTDLAAVSGDASQLQQVIMNLAVNARDAMPSGGLLIVETSTIQLEGRTAEDAGLAPGEYVQLTVADSGQGMTREVKARIFEPFFTTKAIGRGTGLGLSTVYGIVQSVGGTIAVRSDVGRGTCFKLYFPKAALRAQDAEPPVDRRPDLPTGDETIVVVDDDPSVRAFAARVLRIAGYCVLEAETPARGLELAECEARVDAILTDIMMPGMNGCELAKRIWMKRPALPVLYMSGYTDQVLREQELALDDRTLLEKPFTATQLLGKVREVLSATAPAPESFHPAVM
jgi:two-component system, cell cycle sensor histidine kinase and response regulator CckA